MVDLDLNFQRSFDHVGKQKCLMLCCTEKLLQLI